MWLFNFFLLERTLKQELQKWQKGPNRILTILPSSILHIPLVPPLPLHLLLIIIIILFLLPILLFLTLYQEVWKASRPALLSCRNLQDRHWDVCLQVWPPPAPVQVPKYCQI